ncbi:MAG: OpgC protein [Hyphomicrobiales bacterium]|nr:OpgC protein [Hyphomicrobiales bacterium]
MTISDSNMDARASGTDYATKSTMRAKPPRTLNEIDFWRGYALIAIFINHVPGIFFERFTHREIGISDSAELFVFLAGFSLRYLAESRTEELRGVRLFMRLEGRAFTLYAAQILIASAALAMMAGAALWLDTPLILQWNNAASFFENPVATQIGIVALVHQMGYFDILPLYIVLMIVAPLVVIVYRWSPPLLFLVSATIWAVTLAGGYNLPTWPVEGVWFFNPLAWQFVFVLGFIVARPPEPIARILAHRGKLRMLGGLIVLAGYVMALRGWTPSPFDVPEPRLFFMNDKTYLTPMRLIHLLGLVLLMRGAFEAARGWRGFERLAGPLCTLGRNSLHVFCAGSLLSLAGQLLRFAAPISIFTDVVVVLVGVPILLIVAWGNEWRTNLRR